MQSESTIPLFPLGLVLMPRMPLPLHIFEKRYKLMIGEGIALLKQFTSILKFQEEYDFSDVLDFQSISFLIAGCEGFSHEEKQRFLEMTSTVERLKKSVESLENIIERMKITAEIYKIIGGNGNIKRGSGSN